MTHHPDCLKVADGEYWCVAACEHIGGEPELALTPGLEIALLRLEIDRLKRQVDQVNGHRRAVVRARLRSVSLEQAIAWLRGRIAYLEAERP